MAALKHLSLYITPTHASVTVESLAERQTSARTVALMIDAMPDLDLAVLKHFCHAVLEYTQYIPGPGMSAETVQSLILTGERKS